MMVAPLKMFTKVAIFCLMLILKCQFHSLHPVPNRNHKYFSSQSGLTCQCPAFSKTRTSTAAWRLVVLLASERAGPISKWAEPHVIPSKPESPWPHLEGKGTASPGHLRLGDFIKHWCHYWLSGGAGGGRGRDEGYVRSINNAGQKSVNREEEKVVSANGGLNNVIKTSL